MLQEQSRLLSLSTEVILLILDLSSNPALIAIGQTCRRLYYVALPIYLERYGIQSDPAPRSFVLHDKTLRALPGLRAAAFLIPSVDDLWCKFQGPEEFYFSRGVRELHCFVHGLSSISSVSLDVGNIDTRSFDGLATAASDAWKPRFIRLLETVLERGCRTLTVAHGHFLVASSLPRLEAPERTFLGLLSRRKQASNVCKSRPRNNKLNSFSIHSNILLSPPFYEWTLQTLHASPITCLSFRVSGLLHETWSLILNAISLPSLACFSAESPSISFPALLAFLRRHPTISTLNLHLHPCCNNKPKSQKKINFLPSLVALRGSPGNIAALLSYVHPDTAQRVREITLVLPVHSHVFHPSDFAALSAQIVSALKHKGVRPASLALRFSVHPYTFTPHPETGSLNLKELVGSVQTLAFSTDEHYAFAQWVMPRLPAWLGANFVQLKNVRLSEDCVVGVDVRGRETVVQAIKEFCPAVGSVVFQDESACFFHEAKQAF